MVVEEAVAQVWEAVARMAMRMRMPERLLERGLQTERLDDRSSAFLFYNSYYPITTIHLILIQISSGGAFPVFHYLYIYHDRLLESPRSPGR